jgi:hypothetical protein
MKPVASDEFKRTKVAEDGLYAFGTGRVHFQLCRRSPPFPWAVAPSFRNSDVVFEAHRLDFYGKHRLFD